LSKHQFLFYLIILALIACFQNIRADLPFDGTRDEPVIFPPPPDSARIQFLTSVSSSTDITGKRRGILRYILGEQEDLPILKPYGISSNAGKIYICDTQLGGLEIIDLENNEFSYFKPTGRGQIFKPVNCALDDRGYLYVSDTQRNQIVIFDSQLKYSGSFGDPKNFKPTDVFCHKDEIWVCDLKSKQIKVFSRSSLNLLSAFPEVSPDNPGYLFSPTNIFLTDEQVYVSDFGDFKIKIYDRDGNFITTVGSYGKSPGQFVRPKGIAVDRNKNLFVADAGFENVQIFDRNGALLMFFGGSYKDPGDMWLPAKVSVDYENLTYFQKYVDKAYVLKYIIYVTNQFGPDKINVYGFIEYR
jgi:hypothetical protein